MCNQLFPGQADKCPAFLRHKSFLVAPAILKDFGIPVFQCIQQPGELIMTCPSAFHCGFNSGFNLAEACNFALKSWIPYGLAAHKCCCRDNAVHIDMRVFTSNAPHSTQATSQGAGLTEGAGCDAGEQGRGVWQEEDVVWAQLPENPAWPGRISKASSAIQRRELEGKLGWWLVVFFGPVEQWAVVPASDILAFPGSTEVATKAMALAVKCNLAASLRHAIKEASDAVGADSVVTRGAGLADVHATHADSAGKVEAEGAGQGQCGPQQGGMEGGATKRGDFEGKWTFSWSWDQDRDERTISKEVVHKRKLWVNVKSELEAVRGEQKAQGDKGKGGSKGKEEGGRDTGKRGKTCRLLISAAEALVQLSRLEFLLPSMSSAGRVQGRGNGDNVGRAGLEKMGWRCGACTLLNTASVRWCEACGAKVVERGSRKQVIEVEAGEQNGQCIPGKGEGSRGVGYGGQATLDAAHR
jgi:hypothetical protein